MIPNPTSPRVTELRGATTKRRLQGAFCERRPVMDKNKAPPVRAGMSKKLLKLCDERLLKD